MRRIAVERDRPLPLLRELLELQRALEILGGDEAARADRLEEPLLAFASQGRHGKNLATAREARNPPGPVLWRARAGGRRRSLGPRADGDKLLFAGLTPQQLDRVAEIVKVRHVAAGEVVVRERDYGETLYVLDEGRVEVRVEGMGIVTEVRAPRPGEISKTGDFFGEMCLLDLEPRCASVVAIEPGTVWEINRDDLYWLFGDDKELQLRISSPSHAC